MFQVFDSQSSRSVSPPSSAPFPCALEHRAEDHLARVLTADPAQELAERSLVEEPFLERVQRPLIFPFAERVDQRFDVLDLVFGDAAVGHDHDLHEPDQRRPFVLIQIR